MCGVIRYGVGYFINMVAQKENLNTRIREILESEARSCTMDLECVTPEYVCRMWGGCVPIGEIATALKEFRKPGQNL